MRFGYYVTAINGTRVGYAVGPFWTHEKALAMVEPARKWYAERDPFSDFYAWGTTKLTANYLPNGSLNHHLGVDYQSLVH